MQTRLPIHRWVREFLCNEPSAQILREQNWLDRHTHLRRINVQWRDKIHSPGHFGRVCPFEMPEGLNVGKILSVAVGAEIRDSRLVIVSNQPGDALGLTATMMPFLEHNDANRQLMGVNMMRQCYIPSHPEPALVQTGNEPDVPDFWYGRNVLTAFVSWGVDTFEDAITISESCAKRFNYPHPVESGDKFANRHGAKGCITRILPDHEMPHLPDGTHVELVYSFLGQLTRMNFGQAREAVMGRIAHAEGRPAIVPPFQAPDEMEIRNRLRNAGLPEDGMEYLTLGRNGKKLPRPSLVGWVYWGCLHHIAREKLAVSIDNREEAQSLGNAEYAVLRDVSAFENLRERINTCSTNRGDINTIANRVATGTIQQAKPPSPMFANLTRRLALTGIRVDLDGENLRFRFERPNGKILKLARSIPHPWLSNRTIGAIGVYQDNDVDATEPKSLYHDGSWWVTEGVNANDPALTAYRALAEINARAERMFSNNVSESLTNQTLHQLKGRLREYLDTLVRPEHLRFDTRSLFSGRAVIEPEGNLRVDQVGIPEKIAWTLFAPLVQRELGDADAIQNQSTQATQTLDAIMERSWIILYRAPAFMLTSFLAFHPVRHSDNAIHLDPIVCPLLNADFDGDQAAIFLPVTDAAQREAGERLSVAAHLARDPGLLQDLLPCNESMWGLADLSLTDEGYQEISRLAGIEVAMPDGFVTKNSIADAMRSVLKRDGINKTLERLENLMQRGFKHAKHSGASMSPFFGATVVKPPLPENDDIDGWDAYAEQIREQITSCRDFHDHDLGPQLLALKSGARGQIESLCQYLVRWNDNLSSAARASTSPLPVLHGLRDGITPDELRATIRQHWEGLIWTDEKMGQLHEGIGGVGRGFGVIARAMQAKRPGIVFANAAITDEIDPLADVDSRLFVGLPVKRDA